MTHASQHAHNVSRRKVPAVWAHCKLCRREYERTLLLGEYCGQNCRRLDRERKKRAAP